MAKAKSDTAVATEEPPVQPAVDQAQIDALKQVDALKEDIDFLRKQLGKLSAKPDVSPVIQDLSSQVSDLGGAFDQLESRIEELPSGGSGGGGTTTLDRAERFFMEWANPKVQPHVIDLRVIAVQSVYAARAFEAGGKLGLNLFKDGTFGESYLDEHQPKVRIALKALDDLHRQHEQDVVAAEDSSDGESPKAE